jgi:hypothetical protein
MVCRGVESVVLGHSVPIVIGIVEEPRAARLKCFDRLNMTILMNAASDYAITEQKRYLCYQQTKHSNETTIFISLLFISTGASCTK